MEKERSERAQHGTGLRHVLSGKVALLCLVYFLNTVATYGVFLFLPKILREASGFSGFKLSAITAIPFAVALLGMVFIGRQSDRTGERKRYVAACAFTAALGLVLAAASQSSVAAHRPELHALAARAALVPGRVLGHPSPLPGRRGGGRGHRDASTPSATSAASSARP